MDSTNEINEYLKMLKYEKRGANELYNAVSGSIKYIAFKYLVDKSLTNDVVTNTFCKIFDNIGSFDENKNGKAWISKIAQNEAFTINNNERKHVHASLDDIDEEIACTADDSSDLEFVVDLQNALAKLDEKDREIIELRLFEDRTFEEIASKLNMHVGTVYKTFQRNIKKVADEIL